MEKEKFSEYIKKYGKNIEIEFTEEQIKKLYEYMNLLIEWNKKINLTAIIEPEEIIIKHFIDSMTILKYIEKDKKIIDIGTGAGFPGIPLKIMREDIEVVLLDSLNKRIIFLEEVIKKIKLDKIEAIHARIEDYGKNKKYREKYDIVTSRAVANLSTLAEYMLPMTKIGGKSICMKGIDIDKEIKESKKAITILGGKIQKIENLKLPKNNDGRNIIIIEKTNKTPEKYPRKAGIPSKSPLIDN